MDSNVLISVIARSPETQLKDDEAIFMEKQRAVYILTNKNNTVLYTGVTSCLAKRIFEHKQKFVKGFTRNYNADKLVYYELFRDMSSAIKREKQIKGGSRQKKIDLINSMNIDWLDLYETIVL